MSYETNVQAHDGWGQGQRHTAHGSARADDGEDRRGFRPPLWVRDGVRPSIEGRRWRDVEAELRSIYPDWLRAHGYEDAGASAWDSAKGMVREAWETALDVARTQVDPRTGHWEELASEYRSSWEQRTPPVGVTWADVEPGYHYAVEMGLDPRFQGRPRADVAPYLEAGFPSWAASHGYQVREGQGLWERLKDSMRHVWERAHASRDRQECRDRTCYKLKRLAPGRA